MTAKTPASVFDAIEAEYLGGDQPLVEVVRQHPVKVNYHTVQREMRRREVKIDLLRAHRASGAKNAIGNKHQGPCVDCGGEVLERYTRCRDCVCERRSWQTVLRKYGLTREAYDALCAEQDGRCGICAGPPASDRYQDRLRVDHDHETGAVRGLLCQNCNVALGHLGDKIEGAWAALDYLLRASVR